MISNLNDDGMVEYIYPVLINEKKILIHGYI